MKSQRISPSSSAYRAWDAAELKWLADAPGFNLQTQWVPVDRASLAALRHKARSSMLRELNDLIGEQMSAKLVEAFGGTRLYIPQLPHEGDALTEAIGLEAALKLARIYGGDRIDIPNPNPRRARIVELRSSGLSVDAIARELGCTRRRVFQVLAEARRAKPA